MKLFEILNTETTELLKKVRKNSTGGINVSKLETVLNALSNWSIVKQPIFLDLNRIPRELLDVEGTQDGKYKGKFEISSRKSMADAEEKRNVLLKHSVSKLPSDPKNKTYYVISLSDITENKYPGNDTIYFDFHFSNLFYGTNGYIITAPNGETFSLGKNPSYSSLDLSEFWQWAKQNTSIVKDVNVALNMPDIDTEKKQKEFDKGSARDNVGRCQICFKNQKLTASTKLVHHGYNRPGYGYIVGDCFGTGYQPYELGTDAISKYLKVLEKMLVDKKSALTSAKSGKVKVLVKQVFDRKTGKNTNINVYPDEADWEKLLAGHIRSIEIMIDQISGDIETLNTRLDNWELKELPIGKAKDTIIRNIDNG